MNYKTQKFEKKLIELINTAGLPAINIRYVLENVYRQVKEIETQQAKEEAEELEKKEEDTNNG